MPTLENWISGPIKSLVNTHAYLARMSLQTLKYFSDVNEEGVVRPKSLPMIAPRRSADNTDRNTLLVYPVILFPNSTLGVKQAQVNFAVKLDGTRKFAGKMRADSTLVRSQKSTKRATRSLLAECKMVVVKKACPPGVQLITQKVERV